MENVWIIHSYPQTPPKRQPHTSLIHTPPPRNQPSGSGNVESGVDNSRVPKGAENDRGPPTADRRARPRTTDGRPSKTTADHRRQTAERRPPTAEERPQTADSGPQKEQGTLVDQCPAATAKQRDGGRSPVHQRHTAAPAQKKRQLPNGTASSYHHHHLLLILSRHLPNAGQNRQGGERRRRSPLSCCSPMDGKAYRNPQCRYGPRETPRRSASERAPL